MLPVLLAWLAAACLASAQEALPIYIDGLASGFQDWGWAPRDFANASPVHSGSASLKITLESPWQGVQIVRAPLDVSGYESLSFWLNPGTNTSLRLQIYALCYVGTTPNARQTPACYIAPPVPNYWTHFSIPLASLGVSDAASFSGIVIQDSIGAPQPVFYVDDIELVPKPRAAANIIVKATEPLQTLTERHFGINFNMWDTYFDDPSYLTTLALVREAGFLTARMPGGLDSDGYHWASNTSFDYSWEWMASFAEMVRVATNAGMQAVITVNYRTGTPEEAAAWVRHANITNHLGYKYWEIGNECYFEWKTNANVYPVDPYTYATRAAEYMKQMRTADPSIKIGVVALPGENTGVNQYNDLHPAWNARTGVTNIGWTPILLATLSTLGTRPDFLIHHLYAGWTDTNNLAASPTDPALLFSGNWAVDAADLRQQITDYFGPSGADIELVCTENNCDSGAAGRQSTSLVNGLYYADSFGQMSKTEFRGFIWWALRNGTDTSGWFGPSLYGWRTYGDLGVINGLRTRHPTFYAAKLLKLFARPGDRTVNATSDNGWLAAYAARRANGLLTLLVINKDRFARRRGQIAIEGFVPRTNAVACSYGIPNDEAARTNGPAAARDITTNVLAIAGGNFSYVFPPYSMTVLSLIPETLKVTVVPASPAGSLALRLQGQSQTPYVVETSSDLRVWKPLTTNMLTGSCLDLTNKTPVDSTARFWRATWVP